MHLHTVEVEVTCVRIESVTDVKGVTMRRPFAKTGQKCVVILKTLQTTAMESYAAVPALGRITLRDEGKTIAIGKVMEAIR
jgi:peptide chain release factor subunit 3